MSAYLTKLPFLKRLMYHEKSRLAFRMGPFCSLLPCTHLTHLYVCFGELYQTHLDLLAHLKNLQVLVVKGMYEGRGQPILEHSFPGHLATVQTLKTLHIDTISNGISTVNTTISKLSRLEELHLVDCQVSHVSSGLLQLHQLRALQICNTAFDDHLVLPDLCLLPQLQNLALYCGVEELPGVLLNCTQLTSFSFQGKQSVFDLPIGAYLKNLKEIAVQSYLAKANLFEQTTRLQRLFFQGVECHRHVLSKTATDVRTFAMCVLKSLQQMCVSWPAIMDPQAAQNCLLLNQLLIERCCRPPGSTVL